jgi:aspartyl-tRNA(Asn)/glutamyl-tRNA(Gln) amidotransferase subunit A
VSLTGLLAAPAAARRALDAAQVGVLELVESALDRAATLQPRLGAFAELTPELARAQARRADDDLRAGRSRGPLHGLPLAVKDVIDVAGVPTRMGTPGAGHHLPDRDAASVAALVDAGAIVIGKTTTHELALGMTTPGARNPHDPSRIAGGSSGGSAVAVAAGIAAVALGTDTNGSIRSPAAHCGAVGLKPTREAIPRTGIAALAWTQDTVGLLAPDLDTVEAAWEALRAAHAAVQSDAAAASRAARVRVGVDRDAIGAASPEVARAVTDALAAADVDLVDVDGPDLALAPAASVLAIFVEAAEAWGDALDADPRGFGPGTRGALKAGREVPRAAYEGAKRARILVAERMRATFNNHDLDALALPTVPITATPAGQDRIAFGGRDRSVEALQSAYLAPASLTGQPALSVPCGRGRDDLPIGFQLLGRAHAEAALLKVARRIGITSDN